ncbi:DEAD/DEAH box helicase [Sinorhizobium medicae]|nr:DEAD/DEAH box helicase [Sinorhizobium medicae]MDX0640531.1 DEAD/DEAH box helicase [Sinorhizobium medicae]MDX0666920.1 DEAD/DEAH box helicase [Sinorhizobium medicae]MDX0678503.1 DEAD/DEAH box helicase [Sinorhizobium medicae]MDX0766250.1 DEAD/DEAH box helicase [Sinorhizobium medicae]
MVDFKQKLGGKVTEKPTDPIKLYDTLDREADKGPLRPAQIAVLQNWFTQHQADRDIVIKLHTGQGKTLIGLLMLQSRLNGGHGPVAYLCPNNYLVEQTREQARQFGIHTSTSEGDLPEDFLDSRSIFVTSVQKLFNGLTKFGLKKQSVAVDTILMDDAHACSDSIRSQCQIHIPRDEPAYSALKTLFASELEQQGMGTYADIENEKRDAFLPVPYWAWISHEAEVASILSKHADRKSIKFAWPLLKDMLKHCQCVISGDAIEIEPYIPPLSAFGSYDLAKHRIFMSATVTDDAFLVKGLQLPPKTIATPLTYAKETWSGEKMILLPSLIHEDLDRGFIMTKFAQPRPKRSNGCVVLVPSFAKAEQWEKTGAMIIDGDNIGEAIAALKKGECEQTVVLANRYDGIDLPDKACRILIFDSKPHSESLADLYQEHCRPNSAATLMRTVRTVEQGMGRSVRGEKDYSVIVVVGSDIVRLLRDRPSRRFLSSQMSTQIEIGLEITDMAKQEIDEGAEPLKAFVDLVNQCLKRDEDWKAFYTDQMKKVTISGTNPEVLEVYAAELRAEQAYIDGDYAAAAKILQKLLDNSDFEKEEKGWYLQEQARYNFIENRAESNTLQIAAHKRNRLLLKPPTGVTVTRLTVVSQGRTERVRKWIADHGTYDELNVNVTDILTHLVFGVKAEKFEAALDELSRALGFVGERPDSEWKEGPDNLWALDDSQYILFECKSEVDITRAEVNKREAEQMNRSSAWFEKHYIGMKVKRLIIHPAGKIESAAAFTHEVEGVREADIKRLVKASREFFKSFENQNLKDLSESHIQTLLDAHQLSVPDLLSKYSRKLKDMKSA